MARLIVLGVIVAVIVYFYRARRSNAQAKATLLGAVDAAGDAHRATDGTLENFETTVVLASHETAVLVDFWAPWCGPCRTLSPVLDATIGNYGGRVRLVKVNVDEQPELARQYQIQGIPSVKLFCNGTVAGEFVGLKTERQLQWMIDQHIPSIPTDSSG